MSEAKPLVIGVVTDCKTIGPHLFHALGDKYLRSITDAMQGIPLLIPALGDEASLRTYLSMVDGILLTGSPSNIEPHHYQGEREKESMYDPARDATSLPLINMAIEADLPLFGICRGFQEINVALGGDLHQRVQEVPGMHDHRADPEQPMAVRYGPAHRIDIAAGSWMAEWVDSDHTQVNSMHQQGIKRLADGLQAEARAADGLVEAFRGRRDDRFIYGVQWHPEWKVMENRFYHNIFSAFKRACEQRR